ncbi:class I SAM-dependent methyltransferase [Micrococcus sp. Mcc89]|uniref:class I SAM-dependent methyltransferase n=2 Tax=unclassified Micrococcus TaxID=2620948 RepID=UPI0021194013
MSAPEPGASPAVPNLPGRPARARRAGPNPFETGGEHYDAVRPSYPAAVVDRVLAGIADGADVVELGAGTGLFTRLLAARPADRVRTVTALEPSASMRAVLEREVAAGTGGRVRAVPGTGEATGLPAASADAVVAAQAWHWMDPAAASAEAARVLRPGGRLAAVWNQLDTAVPWVHRLTRIMHAGDVHAARPEQRRFGAPFGAEEHARWAWTQPMTAAGLHGLMASRSYWLRADERIRSRMTANLDWYLHEHLGHAADAVLQVPYVTVAWWAAPVRGGRPR